MLSMILKMTAVTSMYVAVTALLWMRIRERRMTVSLRVLIGLIYGIASVLSTHFGVDYVHMALNVRDMGPLSAGLFFDPVSGIIAGIIGGVERYIAGRFWGVGSYTRVACGVSTMLAGFVAAGMHIFIFRRKKPSAVYAFFMGAVMEVFHMYVVFITHRDDMSMAFYVVRTCAPAMILFTGLGMAASSAVLRVCVGEWRNPFRRIGKDEIPVSRLFQSQLFAATFLILILNQIFSFVIQSQTAMQAAQETLDSVSGDIRQTWVQLRDTEKSTDELAANIAQTDALAIAESIRNRKDSEEDEGAMLESLRGFFGLTAVTLVNPDGSVLFSAGESPVYAALLSDVLEGRAESMAVSPSSVRVVAGARTEGGMIQVVLDRNKLASALDLSGLNEVLSYFHVGRSGTFDLIRESGLISIGSHRGELLSAKDRAELQAHPAGTGFRGSLFGVSSLCRYEELEDGVILLTQLPLTEVYTSRDTQVYESAFADILLFAVIYVLISLLMQNIVVNNLELINASLHRITRGHLDEMVSVRSSSEFSSLSDDINQTVDALKGYIDAAEKRIEQELEFARTIQDSVLPKNFGFPRDDFEIFASMDPAKEVGGDFYDFFFIDQNKLALVIADVSGKGIPAALFMMRAKTTIRGLAEAGQSPSAILCRANQTLCEGNDAEMFVTVWLGILDLTTGEMLCANAGHEFPVLRRAEGPYEYLKDRHGPPLAAVEGVRYREYDLTLNPGDRLFVYTDGIPEAINPQVEQYGPDRLLQVLNRIGTAPMDRILPAVREDISDFADGADQFDDITMLGLHYRGSSPADRTGTEVQDS